MTERRNRILLVAGARPNFMKVAPIIRELKKHERIFEWQLVHTGQHYDADMSGVFFDELGIPEPHYYMGAGGGSHAEQTARIMVAFERYCQDVKPDAVIVVGDVNSTLACAIVAKKLGSRVVHVEAGLRSNDMSMPEEVNRVVTDSISDLFFATEPSGVENLLREGHSDSSIYFVGHVMIDNLFFQIERLHASNFEEFPTQTIKSRLPKYGVVTLHRPSNVDDKNHLAGIIVALAEISEKLPLIFPVHPRTKASLDRFGIHLPPSIFETRPLPYMEFLNLWKDARVVLTDSGGLQEETTALGVPCITLRSNTERPVTVQEGTNVLAGSDPDRIKAAFENLVETNNRQTPKKRPMYWDGRASERLVAVLAQTLR